MSVSEKKLEWIKNFQKESGFEPLYLAELSSGGFTWLEFVDANIEWLRSWTQEVIERCRREANAIERDDAPEVKAPSLRFPQEVCPRGELGECAFARRGIGLECQTCGHYVHPGESPELEQYHADMLAEEVNQ